MVSYSSIKVFINMFTSSLRLLTAPCGVDAVCVQLRIIDTRMTKRMGEQAGVVGQIFWSAEELAVRMKEGVKKGGRRAVIWPENQGAVMYALRRVLLPRLGVLLDAQLGLQERAPSLRNLGSRTYMMKLNMRRRQNV